MLHFVHLNTWCPESSPVGQELARLGVPHRFLSSPLNRSYRRRSELLFRIYPQFVLRTLICSVHSLILSRPRPTAVIVSTEIEALIFGVLRTLLRRRTLIVMQTLIVTPRRSRFANAWHSAYWHVVMAVIDLGVCHARTEIATYARRFPRSAGKLAYIPFGTTVSARKDLLATRAPDGGLPVVVAAGRSGRDYRTLVEAITSLPCRLRIVCDADVALVGISRSEQVELVRDAFGDDYLRLLAGADVVVVPLAVADVSAGQMVLLQAAALRRAVIITRTETTVDYATDEEDALLVPMGDVAALRLAIGRLIANEALRDRLAAAAASRFEREYSTEVYVRRLVAAIEARTSCECTRH